MLPIRPDAITTESGIDLDSSELDQDISSDNNDDVSAFDYPVCYHHGLHGEPLSGFGRGVGLRFIEYYFPQAKESISIASGYFTLGGYRLARPFIKPEVQIHLLVGQEQAREVKKSLFEEIDQTIQYELGTTNIPLHDAVKDLLARIEQGRFIIRRTRETVFPYRKRRFHCKFILCDNRLMWHGSANFTFNGMDPKGNAEQLCLSTDPPTLENAAHFFEAVMAQSRDLLEEVAQCLRAWLGMASPFDAYLKILHCLFYREPTVLGKGGLEPTYFQESVIGRAVHSLAKYDGCLVLAATGLGKTVIGAETTFRITRSAVSPKVIVLAPKNLHAAWKGQLTSRRIYAEYFDTSLLFRKPSETQKSVGELEERLAECDAETVILVDEAHKYRTVLQKDNTLTKRNAKLPPEERRQNYLRVRFTDAIARKARVILLTATPYGTSKQDFNSLLSLLPPSPIAAQTRRKNEEHTATETAAVSLTAQRWKLTKLTAMAEMKPVTILGLHDVLRMAHERGDVDEQGRLFLTMNNGSRQFLPKQLELHRIRFPVLLQKEFAEAFNVQTFSGNSVPYQGYNDEQDESFTGLADTSENNAITSWLSSPAELSRFLDKFLESHKPSPSDSSRTTPKKNTTPKAEALPDYDARQDRIRPLQNALKTLPPLNDSKLALLVSLLRDHAGQGHKVIVFVRRYATALYLEENLPRLLPAVAVACTVHKSGDSLGLKDLGERERIIRGFAPDANPKGRRGKAVQVLIATDADGLGLNMQDACVIINYDLPPSADLLFQRAGRVIRMRSDPERIVSVYTFTPEIAEEYSVLQHRLNKIVEEMQNRHDSSAQYVGGSILPQEDDRVDVPMAYASDILKSSDGFVMPEDSLAEDPPDPDTPFARYDRHKVRAAKLPMTLLSARNVRGTLRRVIVLVKDRETYRCLYYNLSHKRLESAADLASSRKIIDLLQCSETEEKAHVSADIVEHAAIEAFNAWLTKEGRATEVEDDEAMTETAPIRVCAIYLQPLGTDSTREIPLVHIFKESAAPV